MRWLSHLPWLLALGAVAKDSPSPGIKTTSFADEIVNLIYFDDSDTILFSAPYDGTVWQSQDGGSEWSTIPDVKDVVETLKHPTDTKVAIILTANLKHYFTNDRGKTWKDFEIPLDIKYNGRPVSFHGEDSNRILIQGIDCITGFCDTPVFYTLDGFDTVKELHANAKSCMWAKTTAQFSTGDEDLDKNRILCNVEGEFSFFLSDSQIVITDDFFETRHKPLLEGDREVNGIIEIASVTKYLAAAAKSVGSNELALYTTVDTIHWDRATFGNHTVRENAYTILESTNYSMQVDVLAHARPPMGVLFTSNSNGTFFTRNTKGQEYTHRSDMGYVDFEKVANIPGIVLINKVANAQEVVDGDSNEEEVRTEISFDDGRTWRSLQYNKKDLHLHSVTEQKNIGRVFSSPAPGIVMGNGNTGKYLKPRKDSDTYISDDAGLTWIDALDGPHLYEMGDSGSILVAIEDKPTDEISWSTSHGQKWERTKLENKVQALALTTTPDSTSLKFIIIAQKAKKEDGKAYEIIALDFSELKLRKCDDEHKDFEDWPARKDANGDPACLMGHTRIFRRRKADAECFIDEEFKDIEPILKDCPCTDEDYECDFGFSKNSTGHCNPTELLQSPKDACMEGDETYEGPSGYRLIPGNTCEQENGIVKDKPVERPCRETKARPSGSINSTITTSTFKKHKSFAQYFYLERCEKCAGEDETIVARTNDDVVYVTHDHGKHWEPLPKVKDDIIAIYPHQYFNDQVFFLTSGKKVYYSKDRAQTTKHFDTGLRPNDKVAPLAFHPTQPDWLIWIGDKGTRTIAEYSKQHGDKWHSLLDGVGKCDFVYSDRRPNKTELVMCEQHVDNNAGSELALVGSETWFKNDTATLRENVVSFATMAEYIVVALKDDGDLKVDSSIDGKTFADAHFPRNFKVDHQSAYTVLDSSTHAIFLHVTVYNERDREYGSILKSNSNGTNYILAIKDVNRNRGGYVDFEKIQGLEGISFANNVANVNDVRSGEEKKLKTYMTANDGAQWETVRHTNQDGDGKPPCEYDGDDAKCSLHLHGFTERTDRRRGYSSQTAIGILLGHGNVGEFLGKAADADTFMSVDGGISWKMIQKGEWQYAIGDRGSIIAIVETKKKTNKILYTFNEGADWETHQFSNDEMDVESITTVPSDTSMNFLLWGKIDGELATVNVDFSGHEKRLEKCQLREDYLTWSVERIGSADKCLFGHVTSYYRKRPEKDCYNGPIVPDIQGQTETCQCTRADFECDYNHERQPDGICTLVEGEPLPDPKQVCYDNPNVTEYYEVTGYRRIPQTTCQGGLELNMTPRTHPCPDHEDDWNKAHRISGVGLFFAIVLPVAAASAAGWYVWRNWDGKFGRIQLGDGAAGSRIGLGGAFERDAPWIKYPVLAISAVAAVVVAIPMVVSTIWRTLSTRFGGRGGRYSSYGGSRPYTSRGSFQRGRGNYAVIDPDEGELLGDESEEEL